MRTRTLYMRIVIGGAVLMLALAVAHWMGLS